jgi:hypothetical protein
MGSSPAWSDDGSGGPFGPSLHAPVVTTSQAVPAAFSAAPRTIAANEGPSASEESADWARRVVPAPPPTTATPYTARSQTVPQLSFGPSGPARLNWRTNQKVAQKQATEGQPPVRTGGGFAAQAGGSVRQAGAVSGQRGAAPSVRPAVVEVAVSPFDDPFGDRAGVVHELPAPRALEQGRGSAAPPQMPLLAPGLVHGVQATPVGRQPEGVPSPLPPPRGFDAVPDRGANGSPAVVRSIKEISRAVAAKDCHTAHEVVTERLLMGRNPQLQLDHSPPRRVRQQELEFRWKLATGMTLGQVEVYAFDQAAGEIIFTQVDAAITRDLTLFDAAYDDESGHLVLTPRSGGASERYDVMKIKIAPVDRNDKTVTLRVPLDQPANEQRVRLDMLDAESQNHFRSTWTHWTRRGESAPAVQYAKPVYYEHGVIELVSVDLAVVRGGGPATQFLRLDELTDEDQRKFRASFVLPQEDRSWHDERQGMAVVGTLFDVRQGKVYIQDSADGTLKTIALADLSEKDLWFVTDGWHMPAECRLPHDDQPPRCFAPLAFTWTASSLCHKPLYFEEQQLERYGHTAHPCIQPFVSGAHFFGNIAVLPYKMGMNPLFECQYALGFYRPGSCAPRLLHAIPLSPEGAAAQGAVAIGLPFILP